MTTFLLKMIAVITMVIDHSSYYVAKNPQLNISFLMFGYPLSTIMNIIGRIAFIIYAFLIAEGCKHTRSMEKYMFRLLAFAFVSEIPFDYFLGNRYVNQINPLATLSFGYQNVFFTLFLGALAIYIYIKIKEYANFPKPVNVLLGIIACYTIAVIADIFHTDYGRSGVIAIFSVFFLQDLFENPYIKKSMGVAVVFIFSIYMYGIPGSVSGVYAIGGLLGVLCVLLYNGKKGRNMRWIFYAIYPLHLLILGFLMYLS